MTTNRTKKLHHQLSSSSSFVQDFLPNQAVSSVYDSGAWHNDVPLRAMQEERQVKKNRNHSPVSVWGIPEENGNARARTQQDDSCTVTHRFRAHDHSRIIRSTSSTAIAQFNFMPVTQPLPQSELNDSMASGCTLSFSAFHPNKSDTYLTPSHNSDSVLGGPGDDLDTDGVPDGIEGEYPPPLMTRLSDIGPGTRLRDRRPEEPPSSGTQSQGGAGESARQVLEAAGGVAAETPPVGDPRTQAQLREGERGGRDSGDLQGGASNRMLGDLAIDTTRAKFQSYAMPMQRLATYRNWIYVSQKGEDLAEAGFSYTGLGDRVQCFHCGIAVRYWEPGDNPWVEHARRQPTCQFVCSVKSPEFVSAVQAVSARSADPDSSLIRLCDVEEEMRRTESQNNHRTRLYEVSENEDEEEQNDQEMSESESCLAELARENSSLRDRKACKICMQQDVGVVFLPCGHLASCTSCAPAVCDCPMCREKIKGRVRVQMG